MTPIQLPEAPAPALWRGRVGAETSKLYTADQLRAYAMQAAEPYLRALIDLLEDTQHKDHNCGDAPENCPVLRARLLINPIGDQQ